VFFDIGAHHGYYALLARKIMGQSAPIHAFEPSPFHFKILASNTSCQNIILNKFALFSSDGPLAFHDMATGAGSSIINRLLAREIKMRTVTVASTTLDHYCFSHNIYPSFLKIDIESSEFEMLKGGKETLTACKPIIAMEVLGKPYDYANHLRAIAFLKENGYMPFAINDNGDLEPLSDIVPDRDIPFCSDNYIFKAQS
jgi:FkbM family methyltransferase